MLNDQLDFITPRPHWATATDLASEDFCAHSWDFSVGDVTLEIRQEDELVDGITVHGRPKVVIWAEAGTVLSPPELMRLAKQLEAVAHHYARIAGRAEKGTP